MEACAAVEFHAAKQINEIGHEIKKPHDRAVYDLSNAHAQSLKRGRYVELCLKLLVQYIVRANSECSGESDAETRQSP